MTGDFDRDDAKAVSVDLEDQYHHGSYIDTYDPAYKDELYANTEA